jgi:hypothetical protein
MVIAPEGAAPLEEEEAVLGVGAGVEAEEAEGGDEVRSIADLSLDCCANKAFSDM